MTPKLSVPAWQAWGAVPVTALTVVCAVFIRAADDLNHQTMTLIAFLVASGGTLAVLAAVRRQKAPCDGPVESSRPRCWRRLPR